MLISPQQYLNFNDQIAFLRTKTSILQLQNQKLVQQVLKQRQSIRILTINLQTQSSNQQQYKQQYLTYLHQTNTDILAQINSSSQSQMKHLQTQLEKIKQDTNFQKLKQIQRKMTEARLLYHQMVDFYQKIQSLYMVINKTKTAPNLPQLYRWVSVRKAQHLNNQISTNTNCSTQKTFSTAKHGLSPSKKFILKSKHLDNIQKQNSTKPDQRKQKASSKQNDESTISIKNKIKSTKQYKSSPPQNPLNIMSTQSLTQNKYSDNQSFTIDLVNNGENKNKKNNNNSAVKIVI